MLCQFSEESKLILYSSKVDFSDDFEVDIGKVIKGDFSDIPTDTSYKSIPGDAKASDFYTGEAMETLVKISKGSPQDKLVDFVAKVEAETKKAEEEARAIIAADSK